MFEFKLNYSIQNSARLLLVLDPHTQRARSLVERRMRRPGRRARRACLALLALLVVWSFEALAPDYRHDPLPDDAPYRSDFHRLLRRFHPRRLFARSRWLDATHADARRCYGSQNSKFEVYTMLDSLPPGVAEALTRNTLRWTRRHDARLCVWSVGSDRSRKSSWNKIAAIVEGLQCSVADWALWLDADAIVQKSTHVGPDQLLEKLHAVVGDEKFKASSLFFSEEFGNLKERGNPINAGVFVMRVNDRTISFLSRVWNDFHGVSLFHRPEHLEQDALWNFYATERRAFDRDAVIVPFTLFNNPSAQPEDLIHHFAGGGRGHGAERKRDKFTTLANMLSSEEVGDEGDERRLSFQTPDEVYPGRSRFVHSFWPPRIVFRLFPARLIVNECTADAARRGEVVSISGR